MSVILDALAKARRDDSPDRTKAGLTDSRALEAGHTSRDRRGEARRGLLFLVVFGTVAVTLVLCVTGFYVLAVKMGAIAPGWPVTSPVASGGVPAVPVSAGLAGDTLGRVGAVAEPPAEPTAISPGTTTGTGQFPAPAPLSVAASHLNSGESAGLVALPPPDELPIWIQQSPPPPTDAAAAQLTPVAAVIAPVISNVSVPAIAAVAPPVAPEIKIGTILCDESGCTAAANGRTVRVGDVILDYTVMAITADKVTLQRAGESPIVLRPRS